MPTNKGRKPPGITTVRLERIARVSEMYVGGKTLKQIAEEVGQSVTQTHRDVCAAKEMWRTRASDAIAESKKIELARIDLRELEAWKAWKRSIGKHTKTTNKSGKKPGKDGGVFNETSLQSEKLAGDPRFLAEMDKCCSQRCQILGMYSPTRIANPDGSKLFDRIEMVYVNDPRANNTGTAEHRQD